MSGLLLGRVLQDSATWANDRRRTPAPVSRSAIPFGHRSSHSHFGGILES